MASPSNIHALVASVIAFVMLVVWLADPPPAREANAANVVTSELAMADMLADVPEAPPPLGAPSPAGVPPAPPPALPSFPPVVPVAPGDNLANLFKRNGLSDRDLHRLVNSGPQGKRLASIYPGHEFEFEHDDEGNLVRLTHRRSPSDIVAFNRVGDRFEGVRIPVEVKKVRAFRSVTIEHSLYVACQRAGLGDEFASRLADIFRWDVDFILDVRAGDTFDVLYLEDWIDGQKFENRDILAAEFVNQGKSYRAVRYGDGGAASYYTPDGRSMRKAFLRAPLSYSRISSRFNLKRKHPLWNKTMPHRGIDYAAPTGTPVMSTGDGIVTKASHTAANGNYVVIRHGDKYQTKYLHLSAIAANLKVGKSVSQGDVIGRVGSTGWSTGPHLHYEFLVNGVHQNPSTVELPMESGIAAGERASFDAAVAPLLADMTARKRSEQIAYADAAP